MRGYQFSWGLKPKTGIKPLGFIGLLSRLLLSHLAFVTATAHLVWMRDAPTRPSGLVLRLLREAVYTFSFGVTIGAAMDMRYSALQLVMGCLHLLWRDAPPLISDYLDPGLHPPVFVLKKPRSLATFWTSSWHPLFRRSFTFCGGTPLATLAKTVGFGEEVQRTAFLFGVFGTSAFLHEYGRYHLLKLSFGS